MSNQKSGATVISTAEKSQSLGSIKKKIYESRIPSIVSAKPSSLTQVRLRPVYKKSLIKLFPEENPGDTVFSKVESIVKLPNNSGDAMPVNDDVIKEFDREEKPEVKGEEAKENCIEIKIEEENLLLNVEESENIINLGEVPSDDEEERQQSVSIDSSESALGDEDVDLENSPQDAQDTVRTTYEDIIALFESKNDASKSARPKEMFCPVKLNSSRSTHPNQCEVAIPMKAVSSIRSIGKNSTNSKESDILADLQKADQQATSTVKTVEELKRRLGELQGKDKMSDEDNNELQEINNQMKAELGQLEDITKRVQKLVGLEEMSQAEFKDIKFLSPPFVPSDSESYVSTSASSKVNSFIESNFNSKISSSNETTSEVTSVSSRDNVRSENVHKEVFTMPDPNIPVITRQLRESYNMQEKLAADNVDLEGEKYKLQEELLKKDQACDILQNKLTALENEMRLVSKENVSLSERLSKFTSQDEDPSSSMDVCDGACISKIECELLMYKNNTSLLEEQLLVMKNEINCLQIELSQVHKERHQLDNIMKCHCSSSDQSNSNELVQLRDKYKQLKADYLVKEEEAEQYCDDIQKLTSALNQERKLYFQEFDSIRELEVNVQCQCNSHYSRTVSDLEHELNAVKESLSECQDELEQQVIVNDSQKVKFEEYRNKYLASQHIVEEQRKEIDAVRLENAKITERINIEVQRARNSFNDKLKNLTQLPFILEDMQHKLEEAIQARESAEKLAETIAIEFNDFKEKTKMFGKDLEDISKFHQETVMNNLTNKAIVKEYSYLKQENDLLRNAADITAQKEKRLETKIQETMHLARQLESVLEKSSTQVSQVKERNDLARKKLQSQITELELNLAQTRTAAASAQNESDEIRHRMQSQINLLNHNFEDAKMRIQRLQEHVTFLKKSIFINRNSSNLNNNDDSYISNV